jgi:hypothetical protein
MRSLHAVGFALALMPAATAAEVVDLDWGASGRFDRSLSVAPGKFAEVCGKLAQGTRVRWAFDADRPLEFNIHYHVGKDVVYPTQHDAVAKTSGELAAPLDQDYCWMWTNKSAGEAKLGVRLAR